MDGEFALWECERLLEPYKTNLDLEEKMRFNAGSVNILFYDLFKIRLCKIHLFQSEWRDFFIALSNVLEGLENRERIAVEIGNGLIFNDYRLEAYRPKLVERGLCPYKYSKGGFLFFKEGIAFHYSPKVIASVLTKVAGGEYSKTEANKLYISGMRELKKGIENLSKEEGGVLSRVFSSLRGEEEALFFEYAYFRGLLFDDLGVAIKNYFLRKVGPSKPISSLGFPSQIRELGVRRVSDLVRMTERDLLREGLSRKFLEKVKTKLNKLGLSLGMFWVKD